MAESTPAARQEDGHGSSPESGTERLAAYGSLYLDRGERMSVVKEQVKSLVKQNPVHFYFDVIGAQAQGELIKEYVDRVFDYAEKHFACAVSVVGVVADSPDSDPRYPQRGT